MVVFTDRGNEPTPGQIDEVLADAAPCWMTLTGRLADAGAPVEWRYYSEGGWLAKGVGKRGTVAWLSVESGYVRVTCYFAERHRASLLGNGGLAQLHRDIAETPLRGKLLPVTLEVRRASDLGTATQLIDARVGMT